MNLTNIIPIAIVVNLLSYAFYIESKEAKSIKQWKFAIAWMVCCFLIDFLIIMILVMRGFSLL